MVKLLQFVQTKYIPNLKVVDEGGYWRTNDLEGLDERRENLNRAMDILEEHLKSIKIPPNLSKESEIIGIIEKVIREEVFLKFKKRKKSKAIMNI